MGGYGATVRLSDAIRRGAALRPQGFGNYFGLEGGSCVIGAAFEGKFGRREGFPTCLLEEEFPELLVDIDYDMPLLSALLRLNDEARWSREEIADWIDVVMP